MSKAYFKVLALLLVVSSLVLVFAGCGSVGDTPDTTPSDTGSTEPTQGQIEEVDYAGTLKLDMDSDTKKVEVTVKTFVDGDTTHFNVSTDLDATGVLKARYLGVNTPESTGKIEEYGKAASKFTKAKLSEATSIIVESDDANWNIDSTGTRYLVWIWYKTAEDADYRNLNIELLQNGLAIASNSANNRYGSTCMSAIYQAQALKLNVYSGEPDPDFFYGDAYEIDLMELRQNIEDYSGMKVAFNGIVTKNSNQTAYVEAYDADSDIYYGMTVYYGYGLGGTGMNILKVGNEVRIVGTVQYYETGGTWQVSGLTYWEMKPNDPGNIGLISEGNSGAFRVTDPNTFANGTVEVVTEDGETKTFKYAELAMSSSISMENLYVESIYTTDNDGSSDGAMTFTCVAPDGTKISVRTMVLYDDNGDIITYETYQNKTITVKGIVDYFNGAYQIKVFSKNDIAIVD